MRHTWNRCTAMGDAADDLLDRHAEDAFWYLHPTRGTHVNRVLDSQEVTHSILSSGQIASMTVNDTKTNIKKMMASLSDDDFIELIKMGLRDGAINSSTAEDIRTVVDSHLNEEN